MSPREQILRQALALPLKDQVYVANALEEALMANSPEPEEMVENGLLAELQRRSMAYRKGETTAREAADVMADLRRRQAEEFNK